MSIKAISITFADEDDGELATFSINNGNETFREAFQVVNLLDNAEHFICRPACFIAEICEEYLERQDKLNEEELAFYHAAKDVIEFWERHDAEKDKNPAGSPAQPMKKE